MDDIVYFVKDTIENEELRYSLRSLSNFPHGKVWFYGGCPEALKPDYHIEVKQDKPTKWENVFEMFKLACNNDKISKNFWLFNDDFFIMKPVTKGPNYYNDDLYKRVVAIEDKYNQITPYTKQLRKMIKELEGMGCKTLCYALHVPMKINRKKGQELANIISTPMFRSVYGNYFKIGGENHKDVKIDSNFKRYKEGEYLSTSDKTFFYGVVGQQVRDTFEDKCKYER